MAKTERAPAHVAEALKSCGVNPDGILFGCMLDMTHDGAYRDVYLALSEKNIDILIGEEAVSGVKSARRLQTVYKKEDFRTIPVADIKSMQVERMLSTARLIGLKPDGESVLLAVSSIGLTKQLEDFASAFKCLQEGKEVDIQASAYEDIFCPKCGAKYPEQGRKICPNCMSRVSVTLRLFGFFKDYRKKVFAIMAVMLLSTAFSIVSPYVGTKLLFDDVLAEGGRFYGMVLSVILVIFAVRLGSTLLGMLYSYVLAGIIPSIVYDIKMKIFTAMQSLSTSYYTSKQTGALMTRVNRDSNNIYWFFVDGLPYVIVTSITFIGIVTLMLIMSWKLALVTLVTIPTIIMIFRLMWRVFRGLHHRLWLFDSNMSSMVSDTLNGQRVIKAFAKEGEELDRFDTHSGQLAGAEINLTNT